MLFSYDKWSNFVSPAKALLGYFVRIVQRICIFQ